MGSKIYELISKVASGLHWLGRYQECNALRMTSRLMLCAGCETLEDWKVYVEAQDDEARRSSGPGGLRVGDRVRYAGQGSSTPAGTVTKILVNEASVRWDVGRDSVCRLTELMSAS